MGYLNEYDELYTASSSSKTLNTPGLIGSYVMIPNEKIRDEFIGITRRRDFLNSASILGMYATMIGYTQCDDYIDQLNEYIQGSMELVENFIHENLPDFKFERPEATYLAWIDARDVPFTAAIMKGETYGENGTKYLRMNLGCPRSKIEEGLKRFKKAMDYLYNK